jgi:dipeptidyl aminopeptidase/acylaminoacyl peptidase
MKKLSLVTLFLLAACLGQHVHAQQKPALTWKDVSKWRYIKTGYNTLAPTGQWMAYVTGPVEGDQEVVIRKVSDTTTSRYPMGATPSRLAFSDDGRFVAFKQSAKDADAKAARKANKPVYDKLTIVDLSNHTKTEFDKVKSFAFANKLPNWIAIQFVAPETAPKDKDAAKGTDMVLYNALTKTSFNLGSVNEYAFNKPGTWLAYTVDANGQNGNGVYLRNMKSGVTSAIDNDKASYKSVNWTEAGQALALLKAKKDPAYKTEVYSVIGVTKLADNASAKTVYSGIGDKAFTAGQGVNGDRSAYWSEDLSTLFFGTRSIEKAKADSAKASPARKDSTAKARPAATMAVANKDDIEKPDMMIWNWQDRRLQSAQQVQENQDKTFTYLNAYNLPTKHFIQLADSNMRQVMVAPKQLYAIGIDNSRYELMSNLNGQSYADIYLINLKTGTKKILFEKFYQTGNRGMSFAPNGKLASYYQDGNFYAVNFETGEKYNLTGKIKSSFADALDDHNVAKTATDNMGWSADSKYALIEDNNDLWRISADGKSASELTDNWKARKLTVGYKLFYYPDEKGTDLSKPQYFSVRNTATKQTGIARLAAGQLKVLFLDNNAYGNMAKADNAPVFAYSKENFEHAPETFVSSQGDLSAAKQLTTNTPDQSKYAWTSGVKLINYISANGDSLQAALYLPANYEQGKAYPTITYIYERLTDNLNNYTMPGFPGGGFNAAMYTSNGYAVLMPDIKYKLNDPGMSAVACVVPAVQAAISTGVVDAKRVAIHGHSWGGYQTSFLITQTNIFRAAAAGAPLTDLISMYSLIYWNSGGTNQAIFEASQGRLTSGYWDNMDAYVRNSPIHHIKNVQTPLLLLHNDKDGAVDFTQGIEYYNGLRRLNKPVVMITYKGENHGIAKMPNRKDYAVRMMEYFDYWLKDKPAPTWWSKGVNRIDMDKYLEARAFEQ